MSDQIRRAFMLAAHRHLFGERLVTEEPRVASHAPA